MRFSRDQRLRFDWRRLILLALTGCFVVPTFARAAENSVVKKAKSEGALVLYTAWGLDTVQALQKAFAQKYPFIRFDVQRSGSERLLNLTIAEHKQKLFRADVFGGSHLAMINHSRAGHLQKYISAEQRQFPKEYKDPDGYWTAFYMDTRVLAFNTRMLARQETPKSYEDLLLPKWKGKLALEDADYILYGSLIEMMGRERGGAFLKRLAQQDLVVRSGHPLLTQLLSAESFQFTSMVLAAPSKDFAPRERRSTGCRWNR